jgi:AraC-like DNA-binding protein
MTLQRFTLLPQPQAAEADIDHVLPTGSDELPVDVVSVARMAQGGRWRTEAMRSYDRPVLAWFTRGQGRLTVAGRNTGYGPHNLVFLPAKTMHGFTTTGPVLGSVVFLPDDDGFDWPLEPMHLRLHEVQLQRELTGLIDNMQREISNGVPHAARALGYHAGLLSVWLMRTGEAHTEASSAGQSVVEDSAGHRLTEAFSALVERDFRRTEGVQHYAALLGVTPTHLSRVCRRVSGRPALDILTDRRHFEAKRLLSDTRMQISQIAQNCGFASAAYFTRAFRARTGQSPSEFRSQA